MLSRRQHLVLVVLAALAVALVLANAALATSNRQEQARFAERQLYVQQTVGLEGLYREIVKALADLGVQTGDREILNMLGSQGIRVTVDAPAPAAAPAPPAPAPAPAKK
jgi:hypothetical protein